MLADLKVGKLDQQVLSPINGVAGRRAKHFFDAVQSEIYLTTAVNPRSSLRLCRELRCPLLYQIGMICVSRIQMGGSDNVSGAGLLGESQHFQAFFRTGGAIVDVPDDMTMNINHRTPDPEARRP